MPGSVAGTSLETDPSSWQNEMGFFNFLSQTHNFPTRAGLTKHQVHPESKTVVRATLPSLPGINCSVGILIGTISPLTNESSS